MKKLLAILLCLIIVLSMGINCFADDTTLLNEKDLINGVYNTYGDLQELLDKAAKEDPTSLESWIVISLCEMKNTELDFSRLKDSLEKYLSENEVKNNSTRLKYALELQFLGGSEELVSRILDESAGKLGIMSWIYAAHLLKNGAKSSLYSLNDVFIKIFEYRLEDGGFCVFGGSADPDTTAMVLQAIGDDDSSQSLKIKSECIDILSALQRDNGTYVSSGNQNAESCAQVIIALSALGIDAKTDERFIKNGISVYDALLSFRQEDGSFRHITDGQSNAIANVQAVNAAVSMIFASNNEDNIFSCRNRVPDYKVYNNDLEDDPQKKDEPGDIESAFSVKSILYIADAAICIVLCLIMALKKKKSYKTYLLIVIICALAALGINFIKIESASEYYNQGEIKDGIKTYISINCETILDKKDSNGKEIKDKDYIPKDGKVLDKKEITVEKGSSAYDQLISVAKTYKIQTDCESASKYLRSINYIYEFDYGDLSGWMLRINGSWASVGSDSIILNDGDYVEWIYTCNLGEDIGNSYKGE